MSDFFFFLYTADLEVKLVIFKPFLLGHYDTLLRFHHEQSKLKEHLCLFFFFKFTGMPVHVL